MVHSSGENPVKLTGIWETVLVQMLPRSRGTERGNDLPEITQLAMRDRAVPAVPSLSQVARLPRFLLSHTQAQGLVLSPVTHANLSHANVKGIAGLENSGLRLKSFR